jgi:hypothetical protein
MKTKLIWCLAIGAALMALVLWSQGVQWWTLVLGALLLVCPIVVVWVWFEFGRQPPRGGTGDSLK